MIRGIKSRPFEDNPDRCVHFAQRLLVAFWTARQRLVVERLLAFELNATVFAAISVNRHTSPHLLEYLKIK